MNLWGESGLPILFLRHLRAARSLLFLSRFGGFSFRGCIHCFPGVSQSFLMRKEAIVKAYLKQPLESTVFCHMSELSGHKVHPSIGKSKIKSKHKHTAIKHRNN